jgi:hypothetical protein
MDGYAAKLCTRIPGLNGLLPGIGTPPGKSAIRWREFVEQVRVPLPTAQIDHRRGWIHQSEASGGAEEDRGESTTTAGERGVRWASEEQAARAQGKRTQGRRRQPSAIINGPETYMLLIPYARIRRDRCSSKKN